MEKCFEKMFRRSLSELEKEELLNAKVTLVPSCSQSDKLYSATFKDILEKYSKLAEVQRFKDMLGWKHCGDESKEKEFCKLKVSTVPAYTLTTYADEGENLKNAGNFPKQPYYIVDIDFSTLNEANEKVFQKINSLSFVIGSGRSISGFGFYSIVKIDISRIDSKEAWKKAYRELYEAYKKEGIELDKQCSNINRLRVCSPFEFHYNLNYGGAFVPELKEEEKKKKEASTSEYAKGDFSIDIEEEYEEGNTHWKRLAWASTLLSLYKEEEAEILYYDIFASDVKKDGDLETTFNWCKNNKDKCRPSNYCLRLMRQYGWLRKKRRRIEIILDDEDFTNPLVTNF